MEFFMMGGFMMWILLLLAILIVGLTIKKLIELFGKNVANPALLEKGINAIIFWGAICMILGFFAHFIGIYDAMQAIMKANDISPAIVSMGYAMSLITIISGLFIFMVSAVIWFFLRWRYKVLLTKIT